MTFEERLAIERDYLDNLSITGDLALRLGAPARSSTATAPTDPLPRNGMLGEARGRSSAAVGVSSGPCGPEPLRSAVHSPPAQPGDSLSRSSSFFTRCSSRLTNEAAPESACPIRPLGKLRIAAAKLRVGLLQDLHVTVVDWGEHELRARSVGGGSNHVRIRPTATM